MSATASPQVSVVMPVHNGLPYLDAAVESILGQTFKDFEFLILDDASTDGTVERLQYWADRDPRIRLLEVDENLGPALSSQQVAAAATAPIVARMDADDVSHPERLQEELAVFERHPEAGVVACLCDFIDSTGRVLRSSERWRLARHSPLVPFAHGTMMYRRQIFHEAGGYRTESIYWEDQDLITRMSALAPVMVIPRSLYRYRLALTNTRATTDAVKLEQAVDLMYRCTERAKTHQPYDDILESHVQPTHRVDPRVFISLGSQQLWAGGRPRMFARVLRRGKLGLNARTVGALGWTGWASASPVTLRLFLRLLVTVRNRFASPHALPDGPVLWRHP
jgi:glycosyltransferase involved in cell wall biosynthesis